MKIYRWSNNIAGWVVFIIAAVTYLLTIEPTASFWDCGEFISSAYKLEVGHPPGAPIFMLTANLFTQIASSPSMVAMMVNAMSALFSALTILFLFWTITHLARKLVIQDGSQKITLSQTITIIGAGLVGSLACTFSDSFWFSAVEGEVYAYSSMMTGVVFWLILKWEDVADMPHSDRWLILIAYLIGISIAVHLLNLLCIPAIVLVYYFKRHPNPTTKGALLALLISFVIVVSVLYGLMQGIMEVCGWFELLFVNVFKLPYNSGVVFYTVLVLSVLFWAIWETMKKGKDSSTAKISFILSIFLLGIPFFGSYYVLGAIILIVLSAYLFMSKKLNMVALNTVLIGLLVIVIGYSSYALIIIRSTSNTPMDQNSPEDVFTLRSYLSREQYGELPLLYGQTFVSEPKREVQGEYVVPVMKDNGPVWAQIAKKDSSEKDRYFVAHRKERAVYVDELNTFFPRMYSTDARHVQAYKEWCNFKGKRVKVTTPQGQKTVLKPTFGENLKYFLNYQVCFMYWRYFMWNFSGRQNDIQGNGEIMNGNWITGIKFIDENLLGLGPQDNMPDSIAKNKGHNKYYMLPLLLGILGIFFQIFSEKRGSQQFWTIFMLFFMTGLAIVIYVNQYPFQPRERDYSYAGSFYAFCIWIGLGVIPVIKLLERTKKLSPVVASALGSLLCVLIPLQMVSQTWDDHNRSKRYLTRDFGYNYLTTCEPNAIIFTNGDNDTFPLWYGQEVEGYRKDVRVCNLSYLQTDWYIDQMKRQSYESDPLPIDWKRYDYIAEKHNAAYVMPQTDSPLEAGMILDRIKLGETRSNRLARIQDIDIVETNKILIPVDSAGVIANGLVKPENADWIPSHLLVDFGERVNSKGQVVAPAKQTLLKHEMMILDMLKNNSDWSRPIYYAMTVGSEQYLRLDGYFRLDGIANRIMPFPTAEHQPVGVEQMYDNLMNKYKYGNLSQRGLYVDENSMRMCRTFRTLFGLLANKLVEKGDTVRVKEVLDKSLQEIPSYNVPHEYTSSFNLAVLYDMIGEKEKAKEIYMDLAQLYLKELDWYSRMKNSQYKNVMKEVYFNLGYIEDILHFFKNNDYTLFEQYNSQYEQYVQRFNAYVTQLNKKGGLNR
ncbi:MAG: DUF2723 domain-containing protein [Dysgonamonadaceae bacterium]|jgi:hypothetical protein|nr:DUF2723 domain-containing protein [Dysgonamonadaceae bacterium]